MNSASHRIVRPVENTPYVAEDEHVPTLMFHKVELHTVKSDFDETETIVDDAIPHAHLQTRKGTIDTRDTRPTVPNFPVVPRRPEARPQPAPPPSEAQTVIIQKIAPPYEPTAPIPTKKKTAKAAVKLNLNKLIVNAYKVVGFAILTAILAGLVSYLGINLFYFANSSWVSPTIVSPTDEKVLQLSARLAEQSGMRDKLAADRAGLQAQMDDADRVIANAAAFRDAFKRAVSADLAVRRAELRRLSSLTGEYSSTRGEIAQSNQAYAGMSRERMKQLADAHLIDRDQYLTGNYEVAQIAHANLSLAEKSVEIDTKKAELARDAAGLAGLAQMGGGEGSYESLRIKQELERSNLEALKAKDTRDALQQSIVAIDRSLARYDRTLKAIQESPFIRAVEEKITIAFVPYENISHVSKDVTLYACAVGPLFCHKVGKIVEVLPGEVSIKHPLHNTMMRGQMVQVDLVDGASAEHQVLFTGRPPLLL